MIVHEIDSITINGFMAHKHLKLNLCPGINLITGPNRKGKSCIVRALGWALYEDGPRWNDDLAKMELLNQNSDEARVRVDCFDDQGVTVGIERARSRSQNVLKTPGKTHTSGVRDWPALLEAETGFGVDELAPGVKINLNIAAQFDPLFMLSWSPEAVDHALNKLTGAGPIEDAVGRVRKHKRSGQADEKQWAESVMGLEEDLLPLLRLDAAAEQLEAAEKAEASADAACSQAMDLNDAVGEWHRVPVIDADRLGQADLLCVSAYKTISQLKTKSDTAAQLDTAISEFRSVPMIDGESVNAATTAARAAVETIQVAAGCRSAIDELEAHISGFKDSLRVASAVSAVDQLDINAVSEAEHSAQQMHTDVGLLECAIADFNEALDQIGEIDKLLADLYVVRKTLAGELTEARAAEKAVYIHVKLGHDAYGGEPSPEKVIVSLDPDTLPPVQLLQTNWRWDGESEEAVEL